MARIVKIQTKDGKIVDANNFLGELLKIKEEIQKMKIFNSNSIADFP